MQGEKRKGAGGMGWRMEQDVSRCYEQIMEGEKRKLFDAYRRRRGIDNVWPFYYIGLSDMACDIVSVALDSIYYSGYMDYDERLKGENMNMREKELAFEAQAFNRFSRNLEEAEDEAERQEIEERLIVEADARHDERKEKIAHCEECGKPFALIHDFAISTCHSAKVVWKEAK